MNILKKIRRKLYRNSATLRGAWFWWRFVKKNRYLPDFKTPKTYNEKINYRKKDPKNPLFSICADKIRAKEYVAEKIGPEIIIPNYYVGESIDFDTMKGIISEKGDCFLKANHNSGPVHLLTRESTDEEIHFAIKDVQRQLSIDYGAQKNEPWYSNIKRGVLVEKRLPPQDGESDIRDYKFHVFRQKNGTYKIIPSIDFDRSSNHTRSFFDEDLKWLPFSIQYPTIIQNVEKPKNYQSMLEIAKTLAEPFSYARIDLYNNNGDIFFGEITFAHGGGSEIFTAKSYDLWMGNLWQEDPRY